MGVDRQSISNYIERGFLKKRMLRGRVYVYRDSVLAFKEKYHEVVQVEEGAVEAYMRELAEKKEDLRKQIKQTEMSMGYERANYLVHLLRSMVKAIGYVDNMTPKKLEMVENYVLGMERADCGYHYGNVTAERARQILNWSTGWVSRRGYHVFEKMQKQEEEIERLTKRNFQLKMRNKELEEAQKKLIEAPKGRISERVSKILATNVLDMKIKVRTLNILRFSGFETIGDFISMTPKDFMKIPNCGRKSVNELRDYMENLGLHLGMTKEELYVVR